VFLVFLVSRFTSLIDSFNLFNLLSAFSTIGLLNYNLGMFSLFNYNLGVFSVFIVRLD
jgi:hypothetical protein